MAEVLRMSPEMPESEPEEQRKEETRPSSGRQMRLNFVTLQEDIGTIYAAFARALEAAGGPDWLVVSLNKKLSYAAKVSAAVHHLEDRHVFLEWLVPVLRDPNGARILLAALAELAGCDPPKPKRVATTGELLSALLDELETAGSVGADLKERAAKRLGTDPGAFRK